jgi:hypothetical protein
MAKIVTSQTGPYLATALLAALLALFTLWAGVDPFARILGKLPPVAVILGLTVLGTLALWRLHSVGWTGVRAFPPRRVLLGLSALGIAFALPTVLFDILSPWSRDINAPFLEALAFYPAIAFVAETAFHLVPLALLSLLIPGRLWIAALLSAAIEPGFQILADFGGDATLARSAYMAVHLTAFNLVQIALLRRHGFLASFAFRISYYLIWHILWGVARLALLFPA